MKCTLLLAVLSVAVVYGDNLCCFPDQWQAEVYGLFTEASPDSGDIRSWAENVFFDTTNQRIREDFVVKDQVVSYLRLYQQNVSYVFNNDKCVKQEVGNWSDVIYCVPDDATPLTPYRLGLEPGINITEYSWPLSDSLLVDVGLTDSCSPEKVVAVLVAGEEQEDVSVVFEEYRNFYPSVADPTVFDVPDPCKSLTQLIPTWRMLGQHHQFKKHQYLKKHVFEFKQ